MPFRRTYLAASIAAALLTVTLAAPASAAIVVECGQISAYTAPDPAGPTDGSLTIGLLPAWTVAADATISAAATAGLPAIAGSAPSCLTLDIDASDIIHSIDFAATGEITGLVAFDTGLNGYIFDDRLLVPTFITDLYPGLEALFATSYDAGTSLTVVFTVDTTSGQFVAFDGRARFCGDADVASNGDGIVGAATIPAAVLDATDIARLEGAGSREACASIRSIGTINPNNGDIQIATTVRITVAGSGATPPPTDTVPAVATESGGPVLWPAFVVLGLLVTTMAVAVTRTDRRR